MRHLLLPYIDPALNLATEETLLRLLEPGAAWLLIWQNSPSVIIGRHQNMANEVDAEFLATKNIPLLRRITGGGAVYHDLGNLNFSFIVSRPTDLSFFPFMESIRQALATVGISSRIRGRNDLETADGKISGSAQFVAGDRLLHHGTLLLDSDRKIMDHALTPSAAKKAKHAMPSHKVRTANLFDKMPGLSIDAIKQVLIDNIAPEPGKLPPCAEKIAENLMWLKYRNPWWNYGDTPKPGLSFSRAFPWGELMASCQLDGKNIRSLRLTGDFFLDSPLEEIEAMFEELPLAQIRANSEAIEWETIFRDCRDSQLNKFFSDLAQQAALLASQAASPSKPPDAGS